MSLDKVLSFIGRALIGAGILVFLFVGYQLWGTSFAEARNQNHLKAEAAREFLSSVPSTAPAKNAPPQQQPINTTPAPPPAPQGSAVAVIKIPKINLEKAVVEGTGVPDLKRGPGHYLNTPLPGQPGNAALAGHRTTYGAPFGDLGELGKGDEIFVTTRQGTFRYVMSEQKIVSPTDVSVLAPTKENRLTLTTCHPKYSAAKRLVIIATLDQRPAPAAPSTTTSSTSTTAPKSGAAPTTTTTENPAANLSGADLSGTSVSKLPAIIWALLTAAIGMCIWVGGRVWSRWKAYLIGAPIFLIVLFVFFENFSRLLPANA